MKKIITLLFCSAIICSAFAQRREHDRPYNNYPVYQNNNYRYNEKKDLKESIEQRERRLEEERKQLDEDKKKLQDTIPPAKKAQTNKTRATESLAYSTMFSFTNLLN